MRKDDGGPVFPQPALSHVVDRVRDGRVVSLMAGMTMRQWYKGQALTNEYITTRIGDYDKARHIAEYCGEVADAMIAEDEKSSGE